jgi:hypothetical protein
MFNNCVENLAAYETMQKNIVEVTDDNTAHAQ